jgi:uncharacterized membrane protein YgcG
LILLIMYCVREWSRVGRDPNKGIIIARYEPPAGQTPASLRFLMRMSYDMRCFSSEVLALAVAGCLRIVRDKGFFKDEWRLERAGVPPESSSAGQRALFAGLFKGGGEPQLVLKNTNASTVQSARSAHSRAINEVLQPRYYKANNGSIGKAILIGAVSILLALWIGGDAGKVGVVIMGVLMVITLIVFGSVIKAPTVEGRKLMDEVEGLKLYLSVAERDELARMQGPDAPPALDEKRYEILLPYAVALEVEDAWTKKFTAAVGAAAAAEATRRIGWYHGSDVSDLGGLSRAIGSSLTSQISSSATPPGSSSGSGGGGSSGGGGGGGGGGGR